MTKEEICKEVRRLCNDAGLDFFFVTEGRSEWSVSSESNEHLRRMVILHTKDLDHSTHELQH